jgi:hypothetical protein
MASGGRVPVVESYRMGSGLGAGMGRTWAGWVGHTCPSCRSSVAMA